MLYTLDEARREVKDNLKEGAVCPCCGQFAKIYKRRLSSTMAAGLIKLVRKYAMAPTYRHVSELDVSGNGGSFAQLEKWGLIEHKRSSDSSKRVSGLWKPTDKGISFVRYGLRVPTYCETYNGKAIGFSKEHIGIKAALGTKFDYRDLMGWLL